MRVSIDNTTGLMIEAQGNPREGTLIQNALAAGFTDVSERECTEQELAEMIAAKDATLPAAVKTQFTSLEFLDRFTDAEQLAVVSATLQSPQVKLWYDRLLAASYIDLTDPRTEGGIDALISAGLIDASRKAALMQAG